MMRYLLLLFIAQLAFAAHCAAQQVEPATKVVERQLGRTERLISENSANDEALVLQKLELDRLSKQLIDYGVSFRPELADINKRLGEIGQPPKEGEPAEEPLVTEERRKLLTRKVEINGELASAEQLSIRISRSANQIADLRRDIFSKTLFRRVESSGALSLEHWRAFTAETQKAWRAVSSRLKFIWNFRSLSLILASGFALVAAASIWLAMRRVFGRFLFNAQTRGGEITYFSKLSIAFWSIVIPSAATAAFLAAVYGLFFNFGIFTGQSQQLFRALLISLAALVFVRNLVTAVFAPGQPGLRLAPFSDPAARLLTWLTLAMALVHIIDFFLGLMNDALSSPLPVTVAQSMTASLLIGLLLVLIALVRPFSNKTTGKSEPWPAWARLPMLLVAGFVITAAVSGYIGLARFSAAQIVFSSAVLATMLIGIQSGRALGADGAIDASPLGAFLQRRFELKEAALDQIGLLLSFGVYLLVLFVGLPLMALQWGFNWVDVSSFIYKTLTSIKIGTIEISLFAILAGIVLFVVGYVLTRQFQLWLDKSVMARSRIETGVRNSIRTVTGYIGVGLAALIAISVAGFDLSNLAIVAGALSLGIGFGLQNIVNNFVSGLILLVERPFKVGDWIVAGQVSGIVKRISVRATEIETFQKQTVLLPNSELINLPVGNWTHRSHLGRVDVPASVAYGTNPRMVHDLLLEIAAADASVLKVPEPFVVFLGFGESALNFELRFHVKDIMDSMVVATRIRFAIVEAFEQRGIQIPFPQRDLNIKSEDLEFLISRLQENAKSGNVPARRGRKPAAG